MRGPIVNVEDTEPTGLLASTVICVVADVE